MAAVGALVVPWVPCVRREGVAGSFGPVWLPLWRGKSPGTRVGAVGAWPVASALYGRRGVWPVIWA